MRNFFLVIGIVFQIFQKVHSENVVKVLVDDTALLPCHVTVEDTPHVIEWLKRGYVIPIYIKIGKYPAHVNPHFKGRMSLLRNSSTLRISNIQVSDEGWYECRVMYLGDLVSDESTEIAKGGKKIKLFVTDPPAFKSTPPPSIVAREGESLMLRCRVVGKPQPEVTWRKDGWIINDGKNGEIVNGNELRVSSLTRSNRGDYLCQARNSEGQVEHITTVYVQASPEMTVKPLNTTVKEGQDAFFGCKASGFPVNILYSWFYNNVPISQSPSLVDRHRALSDGTFVIYDVTRDDVGKVTCQADNGYGSPPSSSAYLIIEYPATVTHVTEVLYAGEGLNFNIQCSAVGVPQISTITWRKDGIIINNKQAARVQVTSSGILSLSQIRYSDEGHYTCTPYNILGTGGESPIMRVVVKEPPTFRVRPRGEVEGEIGSRLELSCVGAGDPKPNVYWRKDGEDLIITNDDRYILTVGNLTITSISKQDFGKWTCVVSNAVAEVESNVMVYVKYTTPHAISNFTVLTSSMSAAVSWLPGYDGGYPQHYMIWYKRADKGDHMWLTDYVGGHHTEAVVNNLESDSVYQFSLLPENALGSGPFSNTLSAKTGVPPTKSPLRSRDHISPPRSVTYAVDDGTIQLSWKPPFLSDISSLLGYLIEYRPKKNLNPVLSSDTNVTLNPVKSYKSSNKIHKREVSMLETRMEGNSNIAAPLKNSGSSDDAWKILVVLPSNVTSYRIAPNMLFKHTTYEFQISTVTSSAYSAPSKILLISTNGLPVYSIASPGVLMASESDVTAAMLAGGVAGGAFFVLSITAMLGYCYGKCKLNKMTRNHKHDVTRSFLVNRKLKKSISLDSQSHHDEVKELKVTFTKQENKDEVKKPTVRHVWSKFRLTKSKKSSCLINPDLRRTKSLSHGKPSTSAPITPIVRSSDGKFRVDVTNNQTTTSERYTNDVKIRENVRRGVRPVSDSFLPQNTGRAMIDHHDIINEEDEWLNPTCEIDCSQSDIEVRYLPSDQSYRSTPTASDDVSSPCFYQSTSRRESRDLSFMAGRSQDHGYSAMSATAEYVYLKDLGISIPETPRSESGDAFRPVEGAMSPHNPTPAEPHRGKYHAHALIPGGHYHLSPRASLSGYPTQCPPLLKQCGKLQSTPKQYKPKPERYLHNSFKPNSISFKHRSPAQVSGHMHFKDVSRVMSLDRQSKHKIKPSVLPIKPIALRQSLTSHSCSMTSLSISKSSKSLKSFSRRSMSEEMLGISKSDTEFSFTSGSQSTVRKLNSRENNFCSLTKDSKEDVPENINSSEIPNDKSLYQGNHIPLVKGYDPISSQLNHTTSLASNNNSPSNISHGSFLSNHVTSCSPNHVRLALATPGIRDSSASSTESRSRKDASSVDEKYEWDSEFAMESEILEALKNFESCKRTGPVSEDLLHQLQKLNINSNAPDLPSQIKSEQNILSPTGSSTSTSSDINYCKESIERRCAALKREYLEYQQRNPILVEKGFI